MIDGRELFALPRACALRVVFYNERGDAMHAWPAPSVARLLRLGGSTCKKL